MVSLYVNIHFVTILNIIKLLSTPTYESQESTNNNEIRLMRIIHSNEIQLNFNLNIVTFFRLVIML